MAMIESRLNRLEHLAHNTRYDREILRGKVGAVGTAVDMTREAVQTVDRKIDLVHEQVQGLEVKVDGLDVRIDGLDVKVDALGTKVDALDVKFDGLRDELSEQRGMLEQILRRLPILPIEP
jgi:archaellum component FlaC